MGKIHDVVIKKLVTYSDDRGYFREILRDDDHLMTRFGQTSFTKTYPGVIKAFHWHRFQTDYWYCVTGSIRVALVDLREDSPTAGEHASIVLGEWSRKVLKIPPYVAHGYQVLGQTPAQLIYYTTQPYNPEQPDEERLPWDDPSIGYDWTIYNR